MLLSLISSNGRMNIMLYPDSDAKITYHLEPSHLAFNQFFNETADGTMTCVEKSPFTIVTNTILLLGVNKFVGDNLKSFFKDNLFYNEIPFTLEITGNDPSLGLDKMNLGKGFEQNPSVTGCNLQVDSDDGLFEFLPPSTYNIKIPYSFKAQA